MCLIVFSYNQHPRYKLILAANRDEFYERPTRAAGFWEEEGHPEILAGKDLKAGGTWMGVHKDGRWGALTNYRDPSILKEDPPSRGELVTNYLKEKNGALHYLQHIRRDSEKYNGFNLLLGDKKGIYHYSNVEDEIHSVNEGIHGLSNALLDTPWPKLDRAKKDLTAAISNKFEPDDLFEILKDDTLAPEEQLPDTGIPKKWEKAISSIFIKTENYGTRCSTLLFIDRSGKLKFIERRYKPASTKITEQNSFTL